jgi:hypothetical protein
MILWRTLPELHAQPRSPRETDMLRYAAVAIPATTVMWQGQTPLFILAGLVALHVGTLAGRGRIYQVLGGLGLAWAALIKPQLAIIGVGPLVWGIAAWRANRREDFIQAIWICGAAAVSAVLLLLLTIILPGGVTLDTYREFVVDVLPQVADPSIMDSIGSPAFVAVFTAANLGFANPDFIGNLVTLAVVALAALWTIQRRNRPLAEISAAWGVWAMVAPRVAWTWYAAWCLPFFLLALPGRESRWRYGLFVVALALLNLQLSTLLTAFATMLLLIYLAWTSFRS